MIVPLKARGTIDRRGRLRVAARARVRPAGPRCWPRTWRCAPRWRSTTRACTRTSARSRARSSRACCRSGCRRWPGWTSRRATGPAGDGSLIGGDFYDVLPREDGLDLVIGDVTGKGARAAALTAQVRHTLRTAAQLRGDARARCWTSSTARCWPSAARAGATARSRCAGWSSTARRARRSAAPGTRCRWSCAARARSSTSASPAPCSAGCRTRSCSTSTFELGERESLVLFTDGVTEARTTGDAVRAGRAGGAAARGRAARTRRGSPRAWTAPRRTPGERRDDVAVLVARRVGTSAG